MTNSVDEHVAGAPATRIDSVWRAAQAYEAGSAEKVDDDAAAAAFVDALLAELLVCPVWDEDGEPPSSGRAQPKLIEQESGEALALFDSEDRLAAYLDEPSAFIALPGRSFFELAAQHGLAIAFNPEVAPSAMTFSAATVTAVAELASATESEGEALEAGALEARSPSNAPPALMTALQARIAAARGLAREGWLFEAHFAAAAQPELVLGVVVEPEAGDDALGRLASELSRLGAMLMDGEAEMSVALFAEGDAALERVRAVGFGMRAASAEVA